MDKCMYYINTNKGFISWIDWALTEPVAHCQSWYEGSYCYPSKEEAEKTIKGILAAPSVKGIKWCVIMSVESQNYTIKDFPKWSE